MTFNLNSLKYIYIIILTFFFLFQSCKREDPPDKDISAYKNGVFISNEGPFQTGTGTLSFYSKDSLSTANMIFQLKNGRPLGNIVQSVFVHDGKVYIIVNNAGRVEVADAQDLSSLYVIQNFTLPRYFKAVNSVKAYISDWDNTVKVVDLQNGNISKSILVGKGPERIVISGNHAFVLNIGGFSDDNTISVIHTASDSVVQTLNVPYRPCGAVEDKNGKLWILCSGKGWNGFPAAGDTPAALLRYEPVSLVQELRIDFPDNIHHPTALSIDQEGENLYYLHDDGVYSISINATTLPAVAVVNRSFYAMETDPFNGDVYFTAPRDYQQNGWVLRYTSDFQMIDSFQVGIIPGGFFFVP